MLSAQVGSTSVRQKVGSFFLVQFYLRSGALEVVGGSDNEASGHAVVEPAESGDDVVKVVAGAEKLGVGRVIII